MAQRGAVKIPITCLRWQDWTENGLGAGDHQFEKVLKKSGGVEHDGSPDPPLTAPHLCLRLTARATWAAAQTYSGCHTWKSWSPTSLPLLRRETMPRDTGTLKDAHFGGSLQNPHPSFRLTPSCTQLLPLLKDCFTARKEQRKDYNNNLHGTLLGMGFFGR